MNVPLVSFITVCFNGYHDTCELIDSLCTYVTSVSYEIIVVDNASEQDEAARLHDKYGNRIVTIRSEKNLGFAGGNNLGIQASKGQYLFFINNDTYVTDDKLNVLVNMLYEHPSTGGLSPKLRFTIPPYNIQYAGFTPLTPITLRNETIGYGKPDDGTYNTPIPTPYLHGAAMLVKREVIDKVGMMPEQFFLYYEELDWCTHITKAGYELWYTPQWTVFHKESQSTGTESPMKIYYMTRNRLLYAWRNLPTTQKWLSVLYQCTIPVWRNMLLYILQGKYSLLNAMFKGIGSFFLRRC
ncbi:MAG: glycosyltransferase family 2 protein [Prevotellaceae bacterium]|jgi:GT2 family glycosyltransferase|nr:glycosyltransferase family 2 protein [Prevotellaceae bacterium]